MGRCARRCSTRCGCAVWSWPNRVVVSPMDMYSAVDGLPTDFHLVHLGSKALGGAGLVMTEMVCVSPTGRITPGCTGLYTDEQEDAYRRIVDFVHSYSDAAIGLQLGHSGRKGSTRLMWEGMDDPLPEGNWPVVGPSPLPYRPDGQVPRQLTRAEMEAIRDEFVAAAERGARAGFDLLELHCAHGYLLSSFLSPLTNQRTDAYGGSLGQPAALSVGGVLGRTGGVARGSADERADLGDGLAPRRCGHGGGAGDRDGVRRARGGRGRRLDGPGGERGAAGVRSVLPDAVRGCDPQPGAGNRGAGGGGDLVVRRCERTAAGGPGGSVRSGAHAPV